MSSEPIRIDVSDFGSEPDQGGGPGATGMRRSGLSPRAVVFGAFWLVLLALLPFLTLVRLSVFLHQSYGVSGWGSVLGGILATVVLVLLYLMGASIRLGGRGRVPRMARGAAIALVLAYSAYALVYLSSSNVKSEGVRETYSQLTPVLRVAVSTLLLVDRQGILTSAGRKEEDYGSWGLPVNEASLHLPQPDGYVYAVDIRTRGRGEWKNTIVTGYFRAMGFRTLRHVGTADHLHVSLPPNRPTPPTP